MGPSWRRKYLRYKTYFLDIISQYRTRADVKMYLELLLSLTTISILSVFALKPTLVTIAQLLKEVDSKEEIIEKLDEKIGNLEKAQVVYSQERARISLLETAIPKDPSPELFARQVEALSGKDSTTIVSISMAEVTILGQERAKKAQPKLVPLPGESGELSFSIITSSNYPALFSFLSDMENLRRPVVVDKVNLRSPQGGAAETLVLVVSGRTPYLRRAKL